MKTQTKTQDPVPKAECQWIGPEQQGPRFRSLCQCPAEPGRSYCEQHLWQVYQRGTALGRRRKDQRRAESIHMWESLMNEAIEELEDEGFDFR
jgi:hypothetical protein